MWNQQNVVWHPEGVEALSPEQSRFIQTGLTWSAGPWSARLEASRTSFSNLVYFDLNSYLYRNGSNIRIQGIETGVAYHLDRWGLEGFYRNQEARDTSTDEAHRFSSAAVIRRPFQSFGFNAYWTRKPFRADLRWSWFGSRYENFGGYPGLIASDRSHFNDLSAALAWDARKDLSFTLRGQHLLQPKISREDWLMRTTEGENDASMIRGYPAQPPTWTVEARYRF
jgi:outer membrane receptor protein involved in Fe transport